MTIIELCGKPGVGKSTIAAKAAKTVTGRKLYTREALYPDSKVIRNLYVRAGMAMHRIGLYPVPDAHFRVLFDHFPNSDVNAQFRIMDLHRRITRMKGDDVFFLEEGPIQYYSALAYHGELVLNEDTRELFRSLNASEYLVVFCECPNDVCIERLKNRKKIAGRFDPSDPNIEQLLEEKSDDLKKIVSFLGFETHVLDMQDSIDANTDRLNEILIRLEGNTAGNRERP